MTIALLFRIWIDYRIPCGHILQGLRMAFGLEWGLKATATWNRGRLACELYSFTGNNHTAFVVFLPPCKAAKILVNPMCLCR
jgi:hypothetical protein